jgi:hypothetical protein
MDRARCVCRSGEESWCAAEAVDDAVELGGEVHVEEGTAADRDASNSSSE